MVGGGGRSTYENVHEGHPYAIGLCTRVSRRGVRKIHTHTHTHTGRRTLITTQNGVIGWMGRGVGVTSVNVKFISEEALLSRAARE